MEANNSIEARNSSNFCKQHSLGYSNIPKTRCSKVHENNMEKKNSSCAACQFLWVPNCSCFCFFFASYKLANTIKPWAGLNCDILCTVTTPWWSYLQEKLKNTQASTMAIQLIPHKHTEWYTPTAIFQSGPRSCDALHWHPERKGHPILCTLEIYAKSAKIC